MIAYRLDVAKPTLLVNNLMTGVVTDLGNIGDSYGSALSPDGRLVAYREAAGIKVVPVSGGAPSTLCENCSLGEWTADQRAVVVGEGPDPSHRFLRIDVESGRARPVLVGPDSFLNRPHLSPDDRLIAFRQMMNQRMRVLVARLDEARAADEKDWIPITALEPDVRPCGWSPNGRVLYFVSGRDGNRCLYAQRLNPATARPEGEAIAVMHLHNARNFRVGQAGVLSTGPSNAVRGGKFFYDLRTITADIWTMRPAESR